MVWREQSRPVLGLVRVTPRCDTPVLPDDFVLREGEMAISEVYLDSRRF